MKPNPTDTGLSSTQESPGNDTQLRTAEGVTDAQQEAISKLAYVLWLNRGCPIGSADEDWIEAEQQVRGRKAIAAAAG